MRTTHSLVLGLLSIFLHTAMAITPQGTIGLGIEMYKPLCCYACHDSLSSLYLNCTSFSEKMDHSGMDMKLLKRMDMGGESMATTSDACYASDEIWLQTLAYCIEDKCSKDGVSENKQSQCFAKVAANGEPVPDMQALLPPQPPVLALGEEEIWLNVTRLVNEDTYLTNRRTLSEFSSSEERHTRYALIIMFFVVGICLLTGVWNFVEAYLTQSAAFTNMSRKLNQHVFVPALFGTRHLSPLPYRMGYLPKRALSLFIAAYIVLNIVFSAVSYHHVSPNTWYSSRRDEIAAYISNRTGVLSFANIAIAILFSGRNNILLAITGWDQTTSIAIHRWAARVATVQAIIHSIIYTLTHFWSGGAADYYAEAAKAYYWWGIIATLVLCLAIVLAALPLRSKSYEIFLVVHITFAILALVGCWYHIDLRFHNRWGYKVWLYVAFAFWAFDRLARFVRLTVYNRSGSPIAVVKQIPDTNVLQMTIFPNRPWNVRPGQHSFFYIPYLGKPCESHPFSIASWGVREQIRGSTTATLESKEARSHGTGIESPSSSSRTSLERLERNQVVWLVRVRKGMTASLQRRLMNSGAPSLPFTVMTEGLYGGERATLSPLRTADTILCIAGGIGITSAMSFLQQYVDDSQSTVSTSTSLTARASNFVLAWSAKEEPLLRHVHNSLLPDPSFQMASNRRVEYHLWCTGDSDGQKCGFEQTCHFQIGRMNVEETIRSVAEKGKRLVVAVCAPGGMSDEVRAAVVGCLRDGMQVDLIEEAFAW